MDRHWPPELFHGLEYQAQRQLRRVRRAYGFCSACAVAVPWFWDKQPNIESKGVQGVIAQWNADWDLSYTSLK